MKQPPHEGVRAGQHHQQLGIQLIGGVQNTGGGGLLAHLVEAVVGEGAKHPGAAHVVEAHVGLRGAIGVGDVDHRGTGVQGGQQRSHPPRGRGQPEGVIVGGHYYAVGRGRIRPLFGHQQQWVAGIVQHGQGQVADEAVEQIFGMLAAHDQQQRQAALHDVEHGQPQGIDRHLGLGGHGQVPGSLHQLGHYLLTAR